MDNKESDKSLDVEDWDRSEEAATRRGGGNFSISDATSSDIQRVRKALKDEKHILTLKKFNRVLTIFVIVVLIFVEYRSGYIPEIAKALSFVEKKPVVSASKPKKKKNLPPEKDMVTYPYKQYLLDSQAVDEGHKADIEQDTH